MKKKQKRKEGDILEISLGEGLLGYCRVLRNPLFAFYNLAVTSTLTVEQVVVAPILFKIWVMKYAVTDGKWRVVGNSELEDKLLDEPLFFKKDAISGKLFLTKTGADEIPTTREQCEGLECAAVWDPQHVEDRLRDHFAGRPNKWLISMNP